MGHIRLIVAACLALAGTAQAQGTLNQSPQLAIGTGQANTSVVYPISNVGRATNIVASTATGGIATFTFPNISIPTPSGSTATGTVTGGLTRAAALRIIAQGVARASWLGIAFTVGMSIYQNYGISGDGQGGLVRDAGVAGQQGTSTVQCFTGNYPDGNACLPIGESMAICSAWAAGVLGIAGTTCQLAEGSSTLVLMVRGDNGNVHTSWGAGYQNQNVQTTTCPNGGSVRADGLCTGGAITAIPDPGTAAGQVPPAAQGGPTDAQVAAAAAAAAASDFGPMSMRMGDITNPQMNVVPGGYAGPQTTAEDIFGNTTTTETNWDWINTNVGSGQISMPVPSGSIGGIPYTWSGTHIFAGAGGTTHIGYGNSGTTFIPAVAGGWQSTTTTTTRNSSGEIVSQTTQTGTVSQTNTAAPGTDPCTVDPSRVGCRSIGDPPGDLPTATTSNIVFAAEAVNLGSGCPAPHSVSIRGWSMNLNYQPACDVAPIVRLLVLACAAFGVAFFCVNTVKS